MLVFSPERIIVGAVTPHPLAFDHIRPLIDDLAGEALHAKQVHSVANAVVGVVHGVSLSIHAIGTGLATARGLHTKHAIKQVDRLLSNPALNVWALFTYWVPYVMRTTAIVHAVVRRGEKRPTEREEGVCGGA